LGRITFAEVELRNGLHKSTPLQSRSQNIYFATTGKSHYAQGGA